MSSTRKFLIAGVAVAVLVVAGVGGWWFFIRDDAPEAASADSVRETLDEEADSADATDSVEGTWGIDTTIGSFDDFSGNWAGYRIEEELAGIGGNTAVGRTPGVTGDITIAGDQVTVAAFEVDMTTLESDDGRRDGQMRGRGLQTDQFPTASFRLTEPVAVPEDAISGSEVTFEAPGELTLHGVTRPVTITATAQFVDGLVGINGSAPVTLTDYAIEPPVGLSVVSVADSGTFEFQLFLSRA
jgi:polyisoprenoid-binding protein YceI